MTAASTLPRAFVVGWPIGHSRSPLIHGHWLARYGLTGSYTRLAVRPEEIAGFLKSLAERGFVGGNVTVPHKEAAFAAADEAYEEARAVGAANTVWLADGRLHATNTDIYGFMAYLGASAPGWDARDRPVLLLGAGGAARAIAHGFLSAGIGEVRIANRTRERADALASHFGRRVRVVGWDERVRQSEGCGVLVNTTTLGMVDRPPLDMDLSALPGDAVVDDIVYVPLETGLLRRARARGLRTVDGLGMLLYQAVPGFERWFGVRPEVTAELRALILADIDKPAVAAERS